MSNVPVFENIEPIRAAFSALRNRLEIAEVNLTQPLLTDPDISLPTTWNGIGEEGVKPFPSAEGASGSVENSEQSQDTAVPTPPDATNEAQPGEEN